MDPRLDAALQPGRAGRVVSIGSWLLPGLATTEAQIEAHADYWRGRAEHALDRSHPVVVAIGDSLAQGIGAEHPRDAHVHQLAVSLTSAGPAAGDEIGVINLSRSGARIGDVMAVQAPALEAVPNPVRAVVCSVGSNDLIRSARVDRTRQRMRRLLDALAEHAEVENGHGDGPGPGVIVCTVPAKGSLAAKSLNRLIRTVADEHGFGVADVGRRLDSWRGRMAGDGFHPNSVGYQVWVEAVIDAAGAWTDPSPVSSSRSDS